MEPGVRSGYYNLQCRGIGIINSNSQYYRYLYLSMDHQQWDLRPKFGSDNCKLLRHSHHRDDIDIAPELLQYTG